MKPDTCWVDEASTPLSVYFDANESPAEAVPSTRYRCRSSGRAF
ncbi:MAG: hypothetical protein R3F11_15845 [Verrucomicrobiales bacterium]